jgi:hypothetical protein
LDHFQIYKIDEQNFVVETASDNLAETLYWGHLPHLSLCEIETLKSYLSALNPYLLKKMKGDLALESSLNAQLIEFCNKKDYGIQGKADSDGNKSVKADYKIKSDDDKFSFKAEVSAQENNKGEKKGEVVLEFRANH